MPIDLRIEDPAWSESLDRIEELVEKAAATALKAVDFRPERCVISVLLCSNDEIAELNSRFRGRDGPTNVLSWPSLTLEKPLSGERDLRALAAKTTGAPLEEIFLGDLALAFEVVKSEAQAGFKSLEAHLLHLIVHGVLHLLGYDHEAEDEAEAMATLEVAALSAIGVADPYSGAGV